LRPDFGTSSLKWIAFEQNHLMAEKGFTGPLPRSAWSALPMPALMELLASGGRFPGTASNQWPRPKLNERDWTGPSSALKNAPGGPARCRFVADLL